MSSTVSSPSDSTFTDRNIRQLVELLGYQHEIRKWQRKKIPQLVTELSKRSEKYYNNLAYRWNLLHNIQGLRIKQDRPIIQPHPLAVRRYEIERFIWKILRLPAAARLPWGRAFDSAIEANVAQGRLTRNRISGALILYEKITLGVECEISNTVARQYKLDGSWNFADYELPDFQDPRRILALLDRKAAGDLVPSSANGDDAISFRRGIIEGSVTGERMD